MLTTKARARWSGFAVFASSGLALTPAPAVAKFVVALVAVIALFFLNRMSSDRHP